MNTQKINCPKCRSEKTAPIPMNALRRITGYVYPRKSYLCLDCRAHFSRFANPFQSRFSKFGAGAVVATVLLCLALLILWKGRHGSVQDNAPAMKISEPQAGSPRMSIPKMPPPETQDTAAASRSETDTSSAAAAATAAPPPEQAPPEQAKTAKDEKVQGASTSPAPAASLTPMSANQLRKLFDVTINPANGLAGIQIQADGPIQDYRSFMLTDPHRLVIDLAGRWEKPRAYSIETGNQVVTKIRLWKYDNKLRIVGDLQADQKITAVFQTTADGLVARLESAP